MRKSARDHRTKRHATHREGRGRSGGGESAEQMPQGQDHLVRQHQYNGNTATHAIHAPKCWREGLDELPSGIITQPDLPNATHSSNKPNPTMDNDY
ncbi:hypothetical protein ACQPZ2_30500 [Nocardia pseudovaccinii]|uniref:hypothetical protein n=1 Tax=Nocardia pseudovaccinii TaxID=189540 RepID=UPI003D8CE955